MGTLLENLDKFNNFIDFHLNGGEKNILTRKPIGIISKSYGLMLNMLYKNIGSHQYNYDGYGTVIGMNANPYLNSETNPWFLLDENKQKYDNYLSYLNNTYYQGTMLPSNFNSLNNNESLNGLDEENTMIGVIHNYDVENIFTAHSVSNNSMVNPNGYDDTRLGVINNFYLNKALLRSYDKIMNSKTSSYQHPLYMNDANIESLSITKGAYSKFGFTGELGMKYNSFDLYKDMVIPQQFLTNDIIQWATSDYTYDNYSMMNNNVFGNYYDLTYSVGLLSVSGNRTKEFIMKSLYGIDLLSNVNIPLIGDDEISIESLKKISRKKYFVSIGNHHMNYLDMMTMNNVKYDSIGTNNLEIIRLELQDPGNDNFYSYNSYLVYAEGEKNKTAPIYNLQSGNEGANISHYITYSDNNVSLTKNDIIKYTNEQFKANKYKTLIGRFHTDSFNNPNEAKLKKDQTSSAISQYGMSRGRNLLNSNHNDNTTNLFHDPYCRVWTYHKQYSKYNDLIRPFFSEDKDNLDEFLKQTFQKQRSHLIEYGVRNKTNGLINYIPEKNDTYYKRCMFSIENLAWKNDPLLEDNSMYTKGPNGGRIMWFPPYGLTFNENVNANWNSTQFIGRGEKIYSYVDTERSGNLTFNLLIDHPSIINSINKGSDTSGDVDDVMSKEQQLLRFFAGCEIFGLPQQQNDDDQMEENAQDATIVDDSFDKKISFNVYFPNYYSGVDDGNDFVFYLCNGLGGNEDTYKDGHFSFSNNRDERVGGYEQQTYNNCGLSIISNYDTENTLAKVDKWSGATLIEDNKEVIKYNNKWGYLVDEKYKNKSLSKNENYLDTISFQLNVKNNNSESNDDNILYCSFNDMVAYFENEFAINSYLNCDSDKVQQISGLCSQYTIKKININGYASSVGNTSENQELARNRGNSIKQWLESKLNNFTNYEVTINEAIIGEEDENINSQSSKECRRVEVTILFTTAEIVSPQCNIAEEVDNQDNNTIINMNYLENIAFSHLSLNEINHLEDEYKIYNLNINNSVEKKSPSHIQLYNELDFFQYVESGNTIMRHKIIDKIKYFDPAFHSITPEGFNNRLTFLHQCTRQGATKSSSETNGANINNLSFGAPPICVLRIGDFYHTKIIIETLNITYDETCWDLNDEGIGVMPMMAKIDISFKFIGGSDLSGPIARLQNAVSFNYYANTKVYDDNAIKNDIN